MSSTLVIHVVVSVQAPSIIHIWPQHHIQFLCSNIQLHVLVMPRAIQCSVCVMSTYMYASE